MKIKALDVMSTSSHLLYVLHTLKKIKENLNIYL